VTPAIRTPEGSRCGRGVVVVPVVPVLVVAVLVVTVLVVPVLVVPDEVVVVPVVLLVVVSATTAADIVPAKPNPSTKRTANPMRLTPEV